MGQMMTRGELLHLVKTFDGTTCGIHGVEALAICLACRRILCRLCETRACQCDNDE